jgi:hypothetical protein
MATILPRRLRPGVTGRPAVGGSVVDGGEVPAEVVSFGPAEIAAEGALI